MRIRRGVLGRVPRFFQLGLRSRNILIGQSLLVQVVVQAHVSDHHVERSHTRARDPLLTSDRRLVGTILSSTRSGSCATSRHLILFHTL